MDPTKDWLLRTIVTLGQALSRGERGTRTEIPRPDNALGDDDLLPEILNEMIAAGKLDEAENLLYRFIENYPLAENYGIGLDFYERLSRLSDEELARDGWSRREIRDGIADLHRLIFREEPPFDLEDEDEED
ncbi:MAG: DUF6483 family protein [Bacillota bacterium]|jgi:hypothetical protein